jgi:hypothetical protein
VCFSKVEISWSIFLTLILSNEAYKKSKQNNDETREAGILISLLMIEADLLRHINFEDLIKDFANKRK